MCNCELEITDLTYRILGERLLTEFDSKKLVDWAVELMKRGFETESIVILAGLDYETTEVREEYFNQCLTELNFQNDKSNDELIGYYATHIAHEVIKEKIRPTNALSIMQFIVGATDYSSRFIQFYELGEDYSYLKYDGGSIYNSGLTEENIDGYIIREFELFLELEELNLKESDYKKTLCTICGTHAEAILISKYQFKRPFKYQQWTCSNCKSSEILHFSSQEGKTRMIEQIKNTQHLI